MEEAAEEAEPTNQYNEGWRTWAGRKGAGACYSCPWRGTQLRRELNNKLPSMKCKVSASDHFCLTGVVHCFLRSECGSGVAPAVKGGVDWERGVLRKRWEGQGTKSEDDHGCVQSSLPW